MFNPTKPATQSNPKKTSNPKPQTHRTSQTPKTLNPKNPTNPKILKAPYNLQSQMGQVWRPKEAGALRWGPLELREAAAPGLGGTGLGF